MKPTLETLLFGASLFTLGLGTIMPSSVYANSSFGPQVERVDLEEKDGIHIDVVLKNVSNNKHVNAVQIQPNKSMLELPLQGFVKCTKDKGTDFIGAKAYFGTVSLQNGDIVENSVLYSADYNPSHTEWEGFGNGQWVGESGNHEPFVVPLVSLKNGHPALRFDPVAELDKKFQQHINQGKSAIDFYKNEQIITVQRPISLSGTCREAAKSSGLGKQPNTGSTISSGYRTIMADLTVRYEGDPAVNDMPVMNAQLNQGGGMPGQVTNDLPIQLVSASFQPNLPHYSGKCIPEQNPKIQINFQLSGKKEGIMDLRVVPDSSNTYGTTSGPYATLSNLPVDAQHSKKVDFAFPLIPMLSKDQFSYMAVSNNKTWTHKMRLEGRIKSEGGDWGNWKELDTAMYNHTCKPQVSIPLGSGQAGKIGFDKGSDNGNSSVINGTIQAVPIKPATPNDSVRAPETPIQPIQIKRAE